jgi:hypothetical protein
MRKNSYCNRSPEGAATQAVLMSVFRTLKQQGFQGTDIVVEALQQYLTTKKIPNLPKNATKQVNSYRKSNSCTSRDIPCQTSVL